MIRPESDSSYVLVVDDDKEVCATLVRLLTRDGLVAHEAHNGADALALILRHVPAAIILDYRMEALDGIQLLKRLKELGLRIPAIMFTAYPAIREAVKATKLGAFDYLAKPFDHAELLKLVRQALATSTSLCAPTPVENCGGSLHKDAFDGSPCERLGALEQAMGESRAVRELVSMAARVAKTKYSVLIIGETGAGKELVATAIHEASSRGPFVAIDCGAIPESIFENELFGHEKGAFTGATDKSVGRLQAANHGTLFLDEVSNLPLAAQGKLLRVLEQRSLTPLGSTRAVAVDVRIVAASNVALEVLLRAGQFRADLFYRLNQFTLSVPPLRERKEDIPYLSRRFLAVANEELGRNVRGFSTDAMEKLTAYHWPGNVRELLHVVRRAVVLAADLVTASDIKTQARPGAVVESAVKWQGRSLREIVWQQVASVERQVLSEALRTVGGNKAQAARVLRIDYKTIHQKLKEYRIDPKSEGVLD